MYRLNLETLRSAVFLLLHLVLCASASLLTHHLMSDSFSLTFNIVYRSFACTAIAVFVVGW